MYTDFTKISSDFALIELSRVALLALFLSLPEEEEAEEEEEEDEE